MGHGVFMGMQEAWRKKLKQNSERLPNVDEDLTGKLSEWVIDLDDMAKKEPHISPPKMCSLFRVPAKIRDLDESAYNPKLVSIGPFHASDKSLQNMNEHKFRYLFLTLHRRQNSANHTSPTEPSNPGSINAESIVKAMKNLERETRNSYSENFDGINSNDFVMMMLLDGCFVIQLLRFFHKAFYHQISIDDPIFTTRWMLPVLQHDLFMLENQLPLFVLEKLFDLTKLDEEPSLIELTLKFFNPLLPREHKILEHKCKTTVGYDHLLAVFRTSFTSTLKKQGSQRKWNVTPEERRLVHSVTELEESGIKFKKMKDRDLLDIKFQQGVLEMPPLMVDDYTKPLFLNMVAYEQCCRERDPYFTDYILFLDCLVNSTKDVEILHYDGIIDHVLGCDEAVAKLINKLSRGVVYDVGACYLSDHLIEIRRYTETKWNRWRANLMHDYFNSPWTLLSVLAAMVLLYLTIIQTVFSFLSYLHPINSP